MPKELLAHNTVQSRHSQLHTVRATVTSYRLTLPNSTESIRTDVKNGVEGFLFPFIQEARKLITKQRDTIELTFKTDLEALEAFL